MSHPPESSDCPADTGVGRYTLGQFDRADIVSPDPQTWLRNLAALRTRQPDLADLLERVELPATWRPVRALDGFLTWRTEPADEPPAWLAGTAAPLTRANNLLAGFRPGDQNPSLPSLAAGAELQLLLQRLPAYRAVYVFETDLTVLAAVLRTQAFDAPIQNGRCILVPPENPPAFLDRLLTTRPGLLPPGNILGLPGIPASRLEAVRVMCEQANAHIHALRARRLAELKTPMPAPRPARQAGAPATPRTEVPRLAILALAPDPLSQAVSPGVGRAAAQLNWPMIRRSLCGPDDVHILPHCEALVAFAPSLALCVNHPATRIPVCAGETVCEWYLSCDAIPPPSPRDGVLWLAGTPRVAAALRSSAPQGTRVLDWLVGCDPAEPTDSNRSTGALVLVADRPDDEPAACGITQPSHVLLWRQLQRTARQAWETDLICEPQALLSQAERAAGLRLHDPESRAWLLGLIEHALIPAAILERITQALESKSIRLEIVGTGWQRAPDREINPFAANLFELRPEQRVGAPAGAIFAGRVDPLSPALLQAGAWGWPLLIHSPGKRPLTNALGGILHPFQHYEPFSGRRELLAAVHLAVEQASCLFCPSGQTPSPPTRFRQRAERVREHLATRHSYARRLAHLLELLADPHGM